MVLFFKGMQSEENFSVFLEDIILLITWVY